MAERKQAASGIVSLLWFTGMGAVFVGERLLGAGAGRGAASGLGGALVLGSLAWRFVRMQRARDDRQRTERLLLGTAAVGVSALLLYFVQSDLATAVLSRPLERDWPRLASALAALWPALWLAAAGPIVLIELAYAAVAKAPRLELGRIRQALYSGLGLAGALVFAFSTVYVATQRDKKIDLSYFRTARPGESTRKIARTLDKPLEIAIFFPPANEVREEVESYFTDLQAESTQLKLSHYDHAVEPTRAKELGVSGNGIVVISRGGRREQLSVGLELESARSKLRNLDKEVQKRLLQVARPGRTVYVVTGHGERGFEVSSETDQRKTVRDLRELLQQQGYAVRTLGAADGLAADVPADAAIVAVIGPQQALLAEELAALGRYLDRGGRLFVALDPEAGLDQQALLSPMGLSFVPTGLANDQVYARRAYQQSDRSNIATASYSSHPSVTSLGRLGGRAPMVLFGAGALEELKGRPKELSIDFTVRAHAATWNDKNGNFAFDPPDEARKTWQLAAAVTRKKPGGKPAEESRALVVGDSDAVSDGVLGNPGNAYFVLDGMKWLLGDEAIAGEIASEVDVPIAHTRKQDVAWFYSSIFFAPALVLGVGFLMARRRRGAARASKTIEVKR